MITKKKEKKEKSKQGIGPRTISPPLRAIEISTPPAIIVTFPHSPFFSDDGYCLGVDVQPTSASSEACRPRLLGVLVLVSC